MRRSRVTAPPHQKLRALQQDRKRQERHSELHHSAAVAQLTRHRPLAPGTSGTPRHDGAGNPSAPAHSRFLVSVTPLHSAFSCAGISDRSAPKGITVKSLLMSFMLSERRRSSGREAGSGWIRSRPT